MEHPNLFDQLDASGRLRLPGADAAFGDLPWNPHPDFEDGHLADERDYGVGAQILREIGVRKMRLMTNNPVKRVGLQSYGLEVVENVPIEIEPNPYNLRYMRTKKDRMGHNLHNL